MFRKWRLRRLHNESAKLTRWCKNERRILLYSHIDDKWYELQKEHQRHIEKLRRVTEKIKYLEGK